MMPRSSVLRKPLICRNQQTSLVLRQRPQIVIWHAFVWGAANVAHFMSKFFKCAHGHQGNMLINDDFHVWGYKASTGVTCSSARAAP